MGSLRNMVMLKDSGDIDVMYITERMLVLTFPNGGFENAYRNSLKEVSRMLKTKHGAKYKIFNLSKRRHDLCKLNSKVAEFGWPEDLAPPLERLCAICKEIENWLSADPQNIIVVHSKGGKNRPAVVIAAYMHYTNICASDDQALDRFAMRRFTDDYVGGIAQPSHRRYVMYFSGLLSGAIKINSSAIYLQHIAVLGLPMIDGKLCNPFLKVYEKMVPVHTSGVFSPESDQLSIRFRSPLALRGDVLVKCFQKKTGNRQVVFRCQFNTCALDFRDSSGANRLTFNKEDLDDACKDGRIPEYCRVEMLFSLSPHSVPLEADMIPSTPEVEPEMPRWDSYENFDSTPEDEDFDLSASDREQVEKAASVSEIRKIKEKPLESEEKSGLYSSIQKGLRDSKSHLAPNNKSKMGTTGPFPVTSSSSQSSPPLPNESTDSGISTASGGKAPALVNGDISMGYSDEVERPIIKTQHNRPTFETANQFMKTFGTEQSSPIIERKVRARDGPTEVVMEASVKTRDLRGPAPTPPPKPNGRTPRASESDLAESRPHSVLPQSKRPLSPGMGMGDGTPSMIDVDLVGKDRYDPQSKAFSYVPSNALVEHFKSPKKQTRWVAEFEGPDGYYHESDTGATSEIEDWQPEPMEEPKPKKPNPPPPIALKKEELDQVEMPLVETPRGRARKTKYNMYRTLDDYSSDMDDLCDPDFYLSYTTGTVVPGTPTKPADSFNFSSSNRARTPASETNSLREEAPPIPPAPTDYKLEQPGTNNYSSSSIPGPRKPARSTGSFGNTPERQSLDSSARDLETFDLDIFAGSFSSSTPTPGLNRRFGSGGPAPSTGRSKAPTSWDTLDDGRLPSLPYMPLSSRSVTSTPVHYSSSRQNSRREDRFSFSSDMDPDEWLENQLEKLRVKKIENDPDIQIRREHEKELLDELKHINEDRMIQRGKNEADYSVEGFGTKDVDPVEEWKREEERLRNAKSPLHLRASYSNPNSPYTRRAAAVGPSHEASTTDKQLLTRQNSDLSYDRGRHPFVAGKPPTPPPRERSRTPPSPRRQSPIRSVPLPSYDQAIGRRGRDTPPPEIPQVPSGYGVRNGGGSSFDHLESLLWDADAPLMKAGGSGSREKPDPNSRQGGNMNLVSQSPKSILKKTKQDFRNEAAGGSSGHFSSTPTTNGPITSTGPIERPSPVPQRFYDQSDSTAQRTAERATGYVEVDIHANRSETPAFPVKRIETPLPFHPLLYEGAEYDPRSPGQPRTPQNSGRATAPITSQSARSPSPGSMYYAHSRRSSWTSLGGEPMEVIHHHPVFVKDTSKYWYKPTISREDAINILKDKQPGTFIVRDSNSFPGAFGLALKVATPPPGVQSKSGDGTELVRHFLIEPSAKGVKLKGCNNEPVFGSLSALVYQHSITPLALPTRLILPEFDPAVHSESVNSAQALLEQGAACNVIYVYSCDTESLTGPEAVRRVIEQSFNLLSKKQLTPTSVHFKVSSQGITVTDNTRKLFFRRHYPTNSVTFCGLDPEDRRWNHQAYDTAGNLSGVVGQARIFGFVAKKISSRTDNACHIFAELEAEQPATAIVNFVTKVMMAPLQSGGK